MERPHLFTLGDNNKIAKVLLQNLKKIVLLNYWASFIIYIIITLLKCIHLFELVSQVSHVAHGPLVCKIQGTFFFRKNECSLASISVIECLIYLVLVHIILKTGR